MATLLNDRITQAVCGGKSMLCITNKLAAASSHQSLSGVTACVSYGYVYS